MGYSTDIKRSFGKLKPTALATTLVFSSICLALTGLQFFGFFSPSHLISYKQVIIQNELTTFDTLRIGEQEKIFFPISIFKPIPKRRLAAEDSSENEPQYNSLNAENYYSSADKDSWEESEPTSYADFNLTFNDENERSLKDILTSPLGIVGVCLIAIGCIISVAAGTGGGSIYVPVLTLMLGLEPHAATLMSQVLMCGGSLAGTLVNLWSRHPTADAPLINFDLVLFLCPIQMSGVSAGIIINRCCATWLIYVLLIICLCVAISQTLRYFIIRRRKRLLGLNKPSVCPQSDALESNIPQKSISNDANDPCMLPSTHQRIELCAINGEVELKDDQIDSNTYNNGNGYNKLAIFQEEEKIENAFDEILDEEECIDDKLPSNAHETEGTSTDVSLPSQAAAIDVSPDGSTPVGKTRKRTRSCVLQCIAIVFIWVVNFMLVLIRGEKVSIFNLVEYCGIGYWMIYLTSGLFLLGCSYSVGMYLLRRQRRRNADDYVDVHYDFSTVHILLLETFAAGLTAGILGVSSSMVLNPLLLRKGFSPWVSSSLNTSLVFLGASLAGGQSIACGLIPLNLSVTLFLLCFVCALFGKLILDRFLRARKADHVLVIMLLLIMSTGLSFLFISGIIRFMNNEQRGFSCPCA